MKKFKTMLQRAWHAGGEALHQKPKRCLVALILCCAGVAHALAPAKDAATDRPNNPSLVESKTEGVTQNNEAIVALEKDLSERMNRLEERERQLYAQSLEASRKSIDWWFGGLAILTSLVAFLGAFLPWLMGRKDKELLQSELQNARDLVTDIKGHEKSAQQAVAKIEEDKLKVASFQSGHEQSPANKEHTRDAAQKVNAEPSSSDSEKLRARAVLASQKDKPTAEEANAAYELWFALTVLKPDDASAHFNAGYWAQQLFKRSDIKDRSRWLAALQKHYQQRLELKKDSHAASYNWGNALAAEARALKEANDLPAARAMWEAAGEKYALALEIKKDKHEPAYNWGLALAAEARSLKEANDLLAARALWKSAGEKYALALEIKKDEHEAANNWGNALADEARSLKEANDLLAARALWKSAGEKYALALEIKKDKHEAANNWGLALAAEARSLKEANDLLAARALWKSAGEKYALALEIKKDKHDAANNWGSALASEAHAIQEIEAEQAQSLRQKAQTLLEYHRNASAQAAAKVAYNLARVYALQGNALACVQQLEVSRSASVLPDRRHLEKEKDLDAVRESPEFQAWWVKHFPD